ncbi:MAG: nicotinate phosphoribosyltransferase [Methanospirillaceae archaeon]|nr:nicotinate phosphoribosyltransferase [Methanospirillaceae archaeon]
MTGGLYTDLYELTMLQSYLDHGKDKNAVFSLYVRDLGPERNFLVACGLETMIDAVLSYSFSRKDIAYLRSLNRFSEKFLGALENYRFSGDIYAVPEGRVLFGDEPIVQVEGSLPVCQVVETLILNIIHHQTLIASKAVRCVTASGGRPVIDFGLRRAHSLESGLFGARATYIAGFAGTSNLQAGAAFRIPVYGTMAHSYILSFPDEEEAFRAYIHSFPDKPVLLIDTYDTIAAAHLVVRLVREGLAVAAVRIDSGDIPALVREVRAILDSENLSEIRILVSGGVFEHDIDQWISGGVPIDTFAVGTCIITASDQPYLEMAYKLVEYDGEPKVKFSPGKVTFPYMRQIVRRYRDGVMDHDEVVRWGTGTDGECLVEPVVRDGQLIRSHPTLEEIHERVVCDLARMPRYLKSLSKGDYPVLLG